jgi:hypothetical protein
MCVLSYKKTTFFKLIKNHKFLKILKNEFFRIKLHHKKKN